VRGGWLRGAPVLAMTPIEERIARALAAEGIPLPKYLALVIVAEVEGKPATPKHEEN
jgi:hypothetical protein